MKIISKPTVWAIYSSWIIFLIFLTGCIKYHEPVVTNIEKSNEVGFKHEVYAINGKDGVMWRFYTNQDFKVGDTLRPSTYSKLPDQLIEVYNELPEYDKNGTTIAIQSYIVRRIVTHPDEGENQVVSHLNLTSAENSVYRPGDPVWVYDNRPCHDCKESILFIIEK